jgi:hypothetical protein
MYVSPAEKDVQEPPAHCWYKKIKIKNSKQI